MAHSASGSRKRCIAIHQNAEEFKATKESHNTACRKLVQMIDESANTTSQETFFSHGAMRGFNH
ncbi:hypothetical protein E2C01_041154 [Portunus trituberculatus]|uniref:Uncharacterized protein n=1 Tax=Portunus trituberculatus TaxID=210409 RepID=A0A5B7FQ64_PORTR|nr:hypothetical protein [Portunus trituberculatus]